MDGDAPVCVVAGGVKGAGDGDDVTGGGISGGAVLLVSILAARLATSSVSWANFSSMDVFGFPGSGDDDMKFSKASDSDSDL